MNQAIKDFIQLKRIAVVGASRSGKKFGNTIAAELKAHGYVVSLVHPEAAEINGERCYPDLASLQGEVDGVLVCVPPQKAGQVVRDAVAAGIKHIWLQQGAQSSQVVALARELGVEPVDGKCIMMYAEPVRSLHRVHRGISRLFGQL